MSKEAGCGSQAAVRKSGGASLRRRIRRWTLFFIGGLVISGLTALPLPAEMAAAAAVLGDDFSAGGRVPAGIAGWLRTLREGVDLADARAPFLLYGTDWLAFGHFMIALAFVGALRAAT